MDEALRRLVDQVRAAGADRSLLAIIGGGTKAFYGGPVTGGPLDVRPLSGISSYEPSELVVTVRAGTPLAELEGVLAEHRQCLPFEPPRFDAPRTVGGQIPQDMPPSGTVGGMVAAGLAGPARAAVGGVRDYVLGATLLNGRAELLTFGGQVMKNVAGYDVSRALAGSMGCLGVICEVSLKVLPLPAATLTLRIEATQADAIRRANVWAGQPLPLNASAWWDGMLVLRLAGAAAAVRAAAGVLGGEAIDAPLADRFWQGLRDHHDEFFVGAARAVEQGAVLWRLSVPASTPPLKLSGEQLLEWGGAQRWICTTAPAAVLREAAAAAGGHAVLFRGQDKSAGVFAPLPPTQERIQRALMQAFDPEAIFNRGRLLPHVPHLPHPPLPAHVAHRPQAAAH
jgi:glycolate oxidase FAD binding subunit